MHWNILDKEQTALLPLFKAAVGAEFYLAGGTGLALQLGHRDSIDFVFFMEGEFSATDLALRLENVFAGHVVTITQQELNTLTCLIDGSVQVSFFGYRYPTLRPFIETEHFRIASIEDIGCMKLSAITGRSVEKDYVDLYFILQHVALAELLVLGARKLPSLDSGLVLKSLVYFDDVLAEPIFFKENHNVSFDEVKRFLEGTVRKYFQEK